MSKIEINKSMKLNERIKMMRKGQHLSQVEMAKILGISQSVISLIESGNASVSVDMLKSLSEYFNVSCDWLIYGKDRYIKLSSNNDFMPMVNIEAEAGYVHNFKDIDYIETLDLYRIPGFKDGEYRIFEVEGESMIPTLFSHDKIICEHKKGNDIVEGTLNVVVTKNDIVVKRVYYKGDDHKTLVLRSDNKDFKPREVPTQKVLEIWEVKAKLTGNFIVQSFEQNSRLDHLENELKVIKDELVKMANGVKQPL